MLVPSLVCAIFTLVFVLQAEKSYLITATVSQPAIMSGWEKGAFRGVPVELRRLAKSSIRDSRSSGQKYLELIRSRELFESYIADQHLKPLLYPKRWDKANQTWLRQSRFLNSILGVGTEAISIGDDIEPSAWSARKKLSKLLKIELDQQRKLIVISLDWPDPVQGAAIVNDLITYANIYIARREQDKIDLRLGLVESLLAHEQYPTTIKLLHVLRDRITRESVSVAVEMSPAFYVVSAAQVPELPTPSLPYIGSAILFSLTWVFMAVQMQLYKPARHRNTAKLLRPSKHSHQKTALIETP